MKFDIYNLTDEPIIASSSSVVGDASAVKLQPQQPTKAPSGPLARHLFLFRSTPTATVTTIPDKEQVFSIPLPGVLDKRKASWEQLTLGDGCPWRVFCHWPAQALVVIPHRNVSSFLADMPDSLSLASLLLPGTHETMAFYGWPISQCQEVDTPLSTQLLAGIRVIDVRLSAVPVTANYLTTKTGDANGTAPTSPPPQSNAAEPPLKLVAYHGVYPQRTPFTTILSTLHTFLTSPAGKSETVVMSLKQEDAASTSPDVWSRLVREEIMASPGGFKNTDRHGRRDLGMWFLENRIPNLGEVRGKVVLFSRFRGDREGWEGGAKGMGIVPTRWPNSEKNGFVWTSRGMNVRVHDWYNIPSFLSIPEKFELSTTVLHPNITVPLTIPIPPLNTPEVYPDEPQLSITYLSAAAFPLALPPAIAKGVGWPGIKFGFEGVNSRTARWLIEQLVPDLKDIAAPELHARAASNAQVNTVKSPEDLSSAQAAADSSKTRGCWPWSKKKEPVVTDTTNLVSRQDKDHQVIPAITETSRRLRGWVLLDYYASDKGLVPLLIECNYRGRRSGQEGWP